MRHDDAQPCFTPARGLTRRSFVAGVGAFAVGGLTACTDNEATPDTVTTGVRPGSPSTSSASLPTTVVPRPTDVIEQHDGYELWRNGLARYPLSSIASLDGQDIPLPGAGGVVLWIRTGAYKWVRFKPAPTNGPSPQEVVYRDLLRAFANQKHLGLGTYVSQLKANSWMDRVLIPDNLTDLQDRVKYPPIAGVPVTIDFKLPFVISNGALALVDGLDPFSGSYDYFHTTSSDTYREFFGVSATGQVQWSGQALRGSTVRASIESDSIPYIGQNVGRWLSILAGLGYAAGSPAEQYVLPSAAYFAPAMRTMPTMKDYDLWKTVVMDVHDYADWSWEENWTHSKLFDEIDLEPTSTTTG